MKKSIATLAIALTLTGFGTVAAQAYSSPETATVSDPVVAPGEQFIFSGSGMDPNEPVSGVASNESGPAASGTGAGVGSTTVPSRFVVLAAVINFSTTADVNGRFSIPLTLTEPGTYTLTATGANSGTQVSAVVTVVETAVPGKVDMPEGSGTGLANSGGQPLANTGADASLLLWGAAGVAALGLGAGGVIVSRRRTKASA